MCARFDAAAAGRRAAGFLVEWELLMPQPMVRRVALMAMQAALAAAGIFAIMLLFSRPAHAATAALPPLTSTQTAAGLTAAGVDSGASTATSTLNSTVAPVITAAKTVAPVTSAAAPVATT